MTQHDNHPSLTPDQRAKYERLGAILRQYRRVIVAYSGGVDSCCLLRVAADCLGGANVLACIGQSESLPASQYRQARELAERMGVPLEIVHPAELANPDYRQNAADRCYHCKSQLYRLLRDLARRGGYDAVLCGTNRDDLGDFRPGLRAASQFQVDSPLAAAGMTKDDIRALSRYLDLPTWDQAAQPCLASRMSYGLVITPERLRQIEEGEEFLRSMDLSELRVRHHDTLVRIEVPAEQIPRLTEPDRRRRIVDFFKGLGFTYVSLDLQGFRSGSANEVLPEPGEKIRVLPNEADVDD
ncbi:MAG: ATP-dependent sacrificial sulfur transferase LarE [Sedimentisphaerales bacterium]|nr:ATP-dependent sacrificial sulfur transferase LarE [Sedimentisphaerales bacterium]